MTVNSIEKRCPKCGRIYPATPEYFYRDVRKKDGLNSYCKRCNHIACQKYGRTKNGKAIKKRYQQSEKGKRSQKKYATTTNGKWTRQNNNLKSKYGFTLREYNQLFQQQGGCCAICRKPETASNKYGTRVLAVDHDHKTGKVRGLLCDRCNRMVGFAKENTTVLQKAIKYLEFHNS